MPAFSATSVSPVKILLVGDSGVGKTGSLVSLAKAGFSLRILDYDNGAVIIQNLLRREAPDKLSNNYSETLTDTFKNVAGRMLCSKPNAWTRGTKLLSSWKVGEEGKDGYYSLGPVESWGPNDVLVIDSLTHMGEAAARYHQFLNGKVGEKLSQPGWGSVQALIRDLLAMLYDSSIRCNVVVCTHLDKRYKDIRNEKTGAVVDRELVSAYPNAPGKALPEEVGSYFNDALQVISQGVGGARRKKICTAAPEVFDSKTSNPGAVAKEYPIETGLAQYFADVRK